MLSVIGDGLAVQKTPDDLDRLRQSRLANRWRIESLADCRIFGEGVSGTETDLQSTAAQVVEARQLSSQMDRIVKVVVEYKRAHPELRGAVGYRHEWHEW